MESQVMHRVKYALVGTAALALAGWTITPGYAADQAQVYVVQGLPGTSLDVSIDGDVVDQDVATAAVVGPFDVGAGSHTMTFADDEGVVLKRTMKVAAASSSDVVVHLPATASEKPVATVFKNDLSSVPRGKARLVVAHTAAVPPADIRVDGKVLFANVANGESLTLSVPADTYSVDIVPTGKTSPKLLGPLDLPVKGGSLDRVYAVGDPTSSSMNVAVHVIGMGSVGSERPTKVNTGTGGQAARLGLLPALFR